MDILKTMKIGTHTVPGFWSEILPFENIEYAFPNLQSVDCTSCTGATTMGINISTKCCTYYPVVPNFLLGFSLLSGSRDTRNIISTLINKGHVLPLGLMPSPIRQKNTLIESRSKSFGNFDKVVCDFLGDNGQCHVYEHRNAVCSSWFCSYGTTRHTEAWWKHLRNLMTHAEQSIGSWAIEQTGFKPESIRQVFNSFSINIDLAYNKKTGGWSDSFLEQVWQGKDPLEVLSRCGEVVLDRRKYLKKIASSKTFDLPKSYLDALDEWLMQSEDEKIIRKNREQIKYKSYDQLKQSFLQFHDLLELESRLEKNLDT